MCCAFLIGSSHIYDNYKKYLVRIYEKCDKSTAVNSSNEITVVVIIIIVIVIVVIAQSV
jgi:uncharacterized membrane protein